MSEPCKCKICVMARRQRAIDNAPTVELYKAFAADLFEIWLNEGMDQDLIIMNLQEQLVAKEARKENG